MKNTILNKMTCHNYRRSLSRIGNICLLTRKADKLLELVLRLNKICIQSKNEERISAYSDTNGSLSSVNPNSILYKPYHKNESYIQCITCSYLGYWT
jgi:hypothetical protein